ncbi:MAG: ABC transporter substrate-binding protein [Chloroflexota bacterium]
MKLRNIWISALLISAFVLLIAGCAAPAAAPAADSGEASAEESSARVVKIAAFGAKSGPLRSFGVNSEAVVNAAVDHINETGIELADGTMAMLQVDYFDSACNAEEAISLVRRLAEDDYLMGLGPTCSGAAEALYGIFQKQVDDESDSGLQFPIFTDTAIKAGLAKISDWTFRNVPNETAMYTDLYAWIVETNPDATTVFGTVETDQGHSNATWNNIISVKAEEAGLEVVGNAEYLMADTSFTTQVRAMKQAEADIVAVSSHPFSTCGLLKEMARQGVTPKILIGLTSSSSNETMSGCSAEAEGMLIPTSFAPVTEDAQMVADGAAEMGGSADLHSAAAWEILHLVTDIIAANGVMAQADTVEADRRLIRDGLAAIEMTDGLLGEIERTDEGEAIKPYLFVQAQEGSWEVVHDPMQ